MEQRAVQWVISSSQGNPLFVRELVLGALDSGTLVSAGGLWRLSGEPRVSASLRELIGERMAALEASSRLPIELLALAEPLRVDELTSLAGLEPSVQAEALGLIAIDTADDARLAHPLYGETLRAELPALHAQRLRKTLAEALLARDPVTPETAMRAARLLLDARQTVPPAVLIDAAHAANQSGDPALGAQLAELALRDGAGLPAALPLARALANRGATTTPRPCSPRSRSRRARRPPRTSSSCARTGCFGAGATSSRRARSSRAPAPGRRTPPGRPGWDRCATWWPTAASTSTRPCARPRPRSTTRSSTPRPAAASRRGRRWRSSTPARARGRSRRSAGCALPCRSATTGSSRPGAGT